MQCWDNVGVCSLWVRIGPEGAKCVEALELLFTEAVIGIFCAEEADPVLQEREDDGRTAKVVEEDC